MGLMTSLHMSLRLLILVFVVVYIFIMSGLVSCFFMLLTYIFIWPFNRSLYRKIVTNLAYMYWSQFTFLGQWWAGSTSTLYLETPDIMDYLGHEHSIVIMNHTHDIDWMMGWMLSERRGLLGGTKIYGKNSLRHVPLLGWAWVFTESIFLKREWETDKTSMEKSLQCVQEYPDPYWVTMYLLCEGTRFTEAKHKISLDVAKRKGLPIMKYHLLPRTKGFVLSAQALRKSFKSIVDMTNTFRNDGAPPTLMNIIMGRGCKSETYIRRFPIEDVPTDNDEECSQWLYKLYAEKDELFQHFVENDGFKKGIKCELPRRPHDLLAYLFWFVVVYLPSVYYFGSYLLSCSLAVHLGLSLIATIVFAILRLMVSVSEIDKGSEYGTKKTKTT